MDAKAAVFGCVSVSVSEERVLECWCVIAIIQEFTFGFVAVLGLTDSLNLVRRYWMVHKHHHRQYLPTRGYIDAANEHPVEQVTTNKVTPC